jgi:5-methylcytosine-specific restriction enzyme A
LGINAAAFNTPAANPSRAGVFMSGVRMAKLTMLRPRIPTIDTRIAPPPPKQADQFYSSPEWIALRDRVRREAGGRCQVPGCDKRGVYVDHIVEIRDGGARLDPANLQLLCAPHHTAKTAAERAKRMGLR